MIENFNHKKELELFMKKHNIRKQDICLVSSVVLDVYGIRKCRDIDFCVADETLLKKLKASKEEDKKTFKNVDVTINKYRLVDIKDSELINNQNFHLVVDGYKVIRPEIEFVFKMVRRHEPKDINDCIQMTEHIEMGRKLTECVNERYRALKKKAKLAGEKGQFW